MRHGLTFVLCLLAFLPAAMITPAPAQSRDNNVITFDESFGMTNMGIALVRDPDLPEEHFIIRLSAHNKMITGCVDVNEMGHSTNFNDIYLNIRIKEFSVNTETLPQDPHIQCNGRPQKFKSDIVLNKNTLIEKGTRHIRFEGGPLSNKFDLHLTPNKVELEPADFGNNTSGQAALMQATGQNVVNEQTIYGRRDALSLWFYPENTIILYADSLEDVRNFEVRLSHLAQKAGFKPLVDILPGFRSPLVDPRYQYYVDTSGNYASNLSTESGSKIGDLTVEKNVYGLEGNEVENVNVSVYAKKPGPHQ